MFDAEAARAAGHPDRTAWGTAAAGWESLGQPYPLAYALLHAEGAAVAAGNRDAASIRLQRAAELAAALRARPLLQQIRRLARRARIEITGGSQATAAELFISPKTASVHVSNILGKLGVASRGEAAAPFTACTSSTHPDPDDRA